MGFREALFLVAFLGFFVLMGVGAYLVFVKNMDVAVMGKLVFGGIGAGALVIALLLAWETRSFVARSREATGIVVRIEEHVSSTTDDEDDGPDITYAPVVAYTTAAGEAHEFTGLGTNPSDYEVGDEVPVLYPPDAPREARIKEFWQLWIAPVVCGVIALVFGGIALVTWRMPL